jgi:hypothetical protein
MKKRYIAAGVLALGLLIYGCSGSAGINPETWNCDNLRGHIIEMSEDKDPKIFELNNPVEVSRTREAISCRADAEMSNGETLAFYEAHVTEGGSISIGYKDRGPAF